jgi:hypothetical protein
MKLYDSLILRNVLILCKSWITFFAVLFLIASPVLYSAKFSVVLPYYVA